MGETSLIALVVQTGFAGLFVWLFFDTRKETREREAASYKREERLMKVLDNYVCNMEGVTKALQAVEIRAEHTGDELQEVRTNTTQILGLLGNRRGGGGRPGALHAAGASAGEPAEGSGRCRVSNHW